MSVKIGHYTGEHIFLIEGVIVGKKWMQERKEGITIQQKKPKNSEVIVFYKTFQKSLL